MSKRKSRRLLSEAEIITIRRHSGNGFMPYRYGSPKPVTLPRIRTADQRIHKGEARRAMVGKAIDLLRGWRLTPFEHEGPTRAGMRSGFVREGFLWPIADLESEALIGEALQVMGANRPTWYQGQPEYSYGREYCATCRGPLDAEAIARHDRFCSTECRTVMRQHRNDNYHYAAAAQSKLAHAVARRESIPKRDCAWCGTEFQPATPDAETCSMACAAKHREFKAGRALADRNCANPKCGKVFHPSTDRLKYCSMPCHREHQADTLAPQLCAYEPCSKTFQPRFAFEKFCSAACRKADLKGRTLEPKPCAACGVEFAPKKASVIFCGKSCASRTRAERERASAFRCEEVTEYREAAE